MRIVVVANLIAGSQYANAINTVKMAEGFALLGHSVSIICLAGRRKEKAKDLNDKYGIKKEIRWFQLQLKKNNQDRFVRRALFITMFLQPHLIYARHYLFPCYSSKRGFPTVGETHAHVGNNSADFLKMIQGTRHQNFRALVTISPVLADYYYSLGVPNGKIAVLPDAVDLSLFERPETLPSNPFDSPYPNIVYSGHLYDYKGIPTILQAARLLPDMNFHLVGGTPKDILRQQKNIEKMKLKNVRLHGLKPLRDVPAFLWHADILLLPPSAGHPSAQWTSPLKLGEYLASGTPVLASSIPALQNLLEDEVRFFTPDIPEEMVAGINEILSNEKYCEALITRGKEKAKGWSYAKRAEQIVEKAKI